jgi:DNA-binding transcriptional LysR family regulator
LGLVAAGLGPTLYPAGIGRLQPQGTRVTPIADCDTPVQTVLAWRRDDRSTATGNFIRMCGVA